MHDQPELEFASKRVNDLLRKLYPDRNLQFMTFVMDEGEGGYLGYLATVRRVDAVRVFCEWLASVTGKLSKDDFVEIIETLKAEKWP